MKLLLYTFILSAAFFCGCLVNGGETAVLNTLPTGKFSPLKKPLVCAYMHIGNRQLLLKDMCLDGVDILNLAFTKITNNRIGLIHPGDSKNFMIARDIRGKYPKIKILVSVGGYGTAEVFSKMCLNDSARAVFVDDAVRFVRYYSLDGIDVDWEFPGMNKNTREDDKKNFTSLMRELRTAFDKASKEDGKKYLLTIAAGAFELYLSYTEIREIEPLTDYLFLMTYDFYGQWNKHTGHHTNLYPSDLQPAGHSVERITNSYIKKGVPAEKIIIGAAFYGRKWRNVEASGNGLFQSGKGVGSVSYAKIVPLLKNPKYTRYWDTTAYAPTLYNKEEKIFISYEDEESVRRKVDYIFMKDLGGIMYWEYFSDHQLSLSKAVKSEFEINKGVYSDFRLPLNVNIKNVKK